MATIDYFQKAIKRTGFEGKGGPGSDAEFLKKDFEKQTKGLDKDLAIRAMEGGRMFGASDRARYEKLLKERNATTPPEKADALKDSYVGNITDSFKRDSDNITDSFNTEMTKNNTARDTGDISVSGDNFGTANTGVIDYSVNIQSGGGGKQKGAGLNNMQSAAAYNALNENQYERSRSKMTGTSKAAEGIKFAEDRIKAASRVEGLDRATDRMGEFYRSKRGKYDTLMFGDYQNPNYAPPRFVAPEDPEKIEVNYGD